MRHPSFDLATAITQPGFTPAVRDADALVELLARDDDSIVRHATRGLVALRAVGREAIGKRLGAEGAAGVPEGVATRLIAALGAIARSGDADAISALLPLVAAPSERWRRAAVVALGKLGGDAARGLLPDAAVAEARAVILARWDAEEVGPAERRALTEALGKLGGGAAVDRLAALDTGGDPELTRRRDRALLMSRRDQWRVETARGGGAAGGETSNVERANALADDSAGEAANEAGNENVSESGDEGVNEIVIEVRGGSEGWDGPTDPYGSVMGGAPLPDEPAVAPGEPRGSSLSSMLTASDVDPEAIVPELPMAWTCRGGLGPLLAEELTALGHRVIERQPDGVVTRFAGPLGAVFAARLWTQIGLIMPLGPPGPPGPARSPGPSGTGEPPGASELAAAITEAICHPSVRDLLPALTRGVVRWRLELASGGPRRAMVWQVVRDVARRAPELINEPADTTWTVVIDERRRTLELRPRRLADPRFAWRQLDLPSASHPTVAAAVAALGRPRGGERVWDPFTGSGSELIECAMAVEPAGAPLELLGTDFNPDALAAAARNAAAAGVPIALERADARAHRPFDGAGEVDLIASNPPLGGRLRGDAGQLLCDAIGGFATALRRGGRLVWITPAPRRTTPAAEAAGLALDRAFDIDLGGLRARLERWIKPR